MIKAVIFDMDGVLVEAKDWHYEALNQALNLFGFNITRDEHLTTYDGLPTLQKLKMLTSQNGLPEGLHNFINEMKQIYTMERVHTRCKPLFVHEYALSKLQRHGYRLAVASNSVANTVQAMMKYTHLERYLDFMLSNEDVKLPKPYPDIYIKAVSNLGLRPEECLVVEDNENGVTAAIAAGAHVLVVQEVHDVNIENITKRIKQIDAESTPT